MLLVYVYVLFLNIANLVCVPVEPCSYMVYCMLVVCDECCNCVVSCLCLSLLVHVLVLSLAIVVWPLNIAVIRYIVCRSCVLNLAVIW